MSKLVRVDDELYAKLHSLAGKLQSQRGKPVSISDAIRSLSDRKKRTSPVGHVLAPARFNRQEAAKESRERKLSAEGNHAFKEFSYKHAKFVDINSL